MTASITSLPVIGVPIKTSAMNGLYSLLSIAQMPPGIPVATVAVNGAKNAGLLAAQILATSDKKLLQKVEKFKSNLKKQVLQKAEKLETQGYKKYLNQA